MTATERTAGDEDRSWMRVALRLAGRRVGQVAPNPPVGCVLVRDGVLVGRGATAPGGRPHAETIALEQAGAQARGATAYVTLEPCSHHGATPPCAAALVRVGVRRVVCALQDPDPRVQGRGFAALRSAGIELETGVCREEAARIAAGFLGRVTRNRPAVTLKLATTADGRIATRSGESRWITGEPARREVHALRARHDALLTGIGTVDADDPELTCRLPGLTDRSPVRVVLDTGLRLATESRLVRTARRVPVLVITGPDASSDAALALQGLGVDVVRCPVDRDGRVSAPAALECLAGRGITEVMAECGGRLATALLGEGLVDRIVWFRAPMVLGGDGVPAIGGLGVAELVAAPSFTRTAVRQAGGDTVEFYRRG